MLRSSAIACNISSAIDPSKQPGPNYFQKRTLSGMIEFSDHYNYYSCCTEIWGK